MSFFGCSGRRHASLSDGRDTPLDRAVTSRIPSGFLPPSVVGAAHPLGLSELRPRSDWRAPTGPHIRHRVVLERFRNRIPVIVERTGFDTCGVTAGEIRHAVRVRRWRSSCRMPCVRRTEAGSAGHPGDDALRMPRPTVMAEELDWTDRAGRARRSEDAARTYDVGTTASRQANAAGLSLQAASSLRRRHTPEASAPGPSS